MACPCWSQDCFMEAGDLPGHLGLESSMLELTGTLRICSSSSLFYRWANKGTERKGLEHRPAQCYCKQSCTCPHF